VLVLLFNTYSALIYSLAGSSWRIYHTGGALFCVWGLA